MTSTSASPSEALKLNWVNVAFFGSFHAIALFVAPLFFSWQAIAVTILLHWFIGSIGICLGYHRLLSHRSLQVPQWVEYITTTIGALAMQGGPIFWAGTHRQHHGFTEDVDKDPYSANRGFWWSHMAWVLYPRNEFFLPAYYNRYAPDVASVPYYRFLDRWFLALQIPLAMTLFAIGQIWGLGWSFVLWGVFFRAVFLWHSTWLINSACHKWGYRNFADAQDRSTNLWWAALLTYGEGWHNNHHAYPKSAKAGLHWWEIDVTWWAISALRAMGLVTRIHLPAPWQPAAPES